MDTFNWYIFDWSYDLVVVSLLSTSSSSANISMLLVKDFRMISYYCIHMQMVRIFLGDR